MGIAATHACARVTHGGRYLHAAGIIHRDLKPSNMCAHAAAASLSALPCILKPAHRLVGEDCDVHICDFGQARLERDHLLTSYIVTRWYRPPEVLLCKRQYNKAVDIWSAGCIVAELVMRPSPQRLGLFPGLSYKDQTDKIIQVSARSCGNGLFVGQLRRLCTRAAHCRQMLGAPSEEDLSAVCDNR